MVIIQITIFFCKKLKTTNFFIVKNFNVYKNLIYIKSFNVYKNFDIYKDIINLKEGIDEKNKSK